MHTQDGGGKGDSRYVTQSRANVIELELYVTELGATAHYVQAKSFVPKTALSNLQVDTTPLRKYHNCFLLWNWINSQTHVTEIKTCLNGLCLHELYKSEILYLIHLLNNFSIYDNDSTGWHFDDSLASMSVLFIILKLFLAWLKSMC